MEQVIPGTSRVFAGSVGIGVQIFGISYSRDTDLNMPLWFCSVFEPLGRAFIFEQLTDLDVAPVVSIANSPVLYILRSAWSVT